MKGIKTARSMTAGDAAAIGTAQLFATLPGISRSGSTSSCQTVGQKAMSTASRVPKWSMTEKSSEPSELVPVKYW